MDNKYTLLFCAGSQNPDMTVLEKYNFDYFIGVDGGALALKECGVTLDYAIGDFDSVMPVDAKKVIQLPSEKDDTDLQYALNYVLEKFHVKDIEEIVIIGALGGDRLDHLICNYYLAYHSKYEKWLSKVIFIEKNNTVRFIKPGQYKIKKEHDKFYVSIIGMTPLKQLTIKNAKYNLKPTNVPYPVSYISNEFIGKPVEVSFEEGLVCIMQTTDRNQS